MTGRTAFQRLVGKVRHFARAREGVAAVEFALILPIMLTLYLGSIELSQAFSVDQRVIDIAGTVGDLVARVNNGQLSSSELSDYFQASHAILAPYSDGELQQVVSVVSVDSNGNTNTVWSIPYNGGSAATPNQPFSLPQAMINISKGSCVVVSDAKYTFPPMLGFIFKSDFHFEHQSFYLPRYDQCIANPDS